MPSPFRRLTLTAVNPIKKTAVPTVETAVYVNGVLAPEIGTRSHIDHAPCSNRENMFVLPSLQAGFLTCILSQDAFPSALGGQWLCVPGTPG